MIAEPAYDSLRLVQAEPRVATILTFSMPGDVRRAAPSGAIRAEVIVFPRTDIRALQRLSETGAPPRDCPAAAPGDDRQG